MDYTQHKLNINEENNRLELDIDGAIAFIDYKLSGTRLFLVHTEVPAALEGKGVGSALVQQALQYAKDKGYKIVPLCTFVYAYLKRHPEWNDVVAPDADRFMD